MTPFDDGAKEPLSFETVIGLVYVEGVTNVI